MNAAITDPTGDLIAAAEDAVELCPATQQDAGGLAAPSLSDM
jgi:hypothetical protein